MSRPLALAVLLLSASVRAEDGGVGAVTVESALLHRPDGLLLEVGRGLYLDEAAALAAATRLRDCAATPPQRVEPLPPAAVGWAFAVGLALGLVGVGVIVAVSR